MIILKTLKWDNCFSYGEDNCIDLTDSKLVQITGTNGVGKSSIPLIIEEVLYNKNSKGIKKADIANRNLAKGYSIVLDFSKDADEYTVQVTRNAQARIKLYKNGEDISSHTATNTYKTLQEILGVEFKTFSQIVYQNTNTSLQFLTATDTNRKKFLIELLNLDNYMELFEMFKTVSKTSNDELSRIQGKCETNEKWLENNKLENTKVLPLLEIPESMEETEKDLRSLLVEIKNISESNKKIARNNEYKERLININLELAKSILASKQEQPLEEKQRYIGSLKSDISKLKASINKMQSLGNVCHTCEQDIEETFKRGLIDAEQKELQVKTDALIEIEKEINRIKIDNAEVSKSKKVIKEWEDTYRSIDKELPSEVLNKTDLEQQANELENKIKERRQEITKVTAENQKITSHNMRVELIETQGEEIKTTLKELAQEREELKEVVANYEVLKKAFSTNGLVAYKIENLVKELEELTNQYLVELSDGRFTLQFVVSNDKLNVEITDNGKVVDISALSSGELARVNTSTLIAIRKLMSSISKSQINVLFLDEVINVLDEAGKEKLVEVLLEEELNTYLVSHGWTHPLLEKIEVVKEANISRLEVA